MLAAVGEAWTAWAISCPRPSEHGSLRDGWGAWRRGWGAFSSAGGMREWEGGQEAFLEEVTLA